MTTPKLCCYVNPYIHCSCGWTICIDCRNEAADEMLTALHTNCNNWEKKFHELHSRWVSLLMRRTTKDE